MRPAAAPHQLSLGSDGNASGEGDGVHRLRDILVEEVSLVDRAANKRRFLVIKRSGDAAVEKELAADGRGGLTAGAGETETPEADGAAGGSEGDASAPGDATKAAGAKPSDGGEKEKPKGGKCPGAVKERKAGPLSMPTAMKQEVLQALTDALERLMAVAGWVKDAVEPGEQSAEASLPDDVLEELQAICDLLSGVTEDYTSKRAEGPVAKAGARMAKDRLERFQKALALLAELLKELTEMKDAAPAVPSAGAAEAGVRKVETPAQAPGVAQLVAGVTELTRVVKRQEEELARLREARGVSNAIQVDAARRVPPADVSWPLDMNRPISRDKVKKEVSFFEE